MNLKISQLEEYLRDGRKKKCSPQHIRKSDDRVVFSHVGGRTVACAGWLRRRPYWKGGGVPAVSTSLPGKKGREIGSFFSSWESFIYLNCRFSERPVMKCTFFWLREPFTCIFFKIFFRDSIWKLVYQRYGSYLEILLRGYKNHILI